MIPLTAFFAGAAAGTVSFSGAEISDTQGSRTATVELEFRADGTYWQTEGATEKQRGS